MLYGMDYSPGVIHNQILAWLCTYLGKQERSILYLVLKAISTLQTYNFLLIVQLYLTHLLYPIFSGM